MIINQKLNIKSHFVSFSLISDLHNIILHHFFRNPRKVFVLYHQFNINIFFRDIWDNFISMSFSNRKSTDFLHRPCRKFFSL